MFWTVNTHLYKDIENDEEIMEMIRQEDLLRQNYHNGHSVNLWADKRTYDLCINVDMLGKDFVTQLLKVLIQ